MAELRKDPVVDRWVIIAPERAERPKPEVNSDAIIRTDPCPFCAGNEGATPPAVLSFPAASGLSGESGWSVRVVPNKYPALTEGPDSEPAQRGFYEAMAGSGIHEVIIESPEHVTQSQKLSEAQFALILRAFRDRILELGSDGRWRQVLVYKNQGAEVGATLSHVHAQLIALPMVPRDVQDEISAAKRYYAGAGRCIYCAIAAEELRDRARLVLEDKNFLVFCPFASRFAYETWILPRQHRAFFELEPEGNYASLARVLREALIRVDRELGDPPFNYIIHSSPFAESSERYYHWHLEILPKLGQVAGFEWGSGWYINMVPPEHAARTLAQRFV